MSRRLITVLTAIIAAALFSGCASDGVVNNKFESPLLEYLNASGFTAFDPPRSGDGAGTIIQFNQRKEETIVFPADKCFPREPVPRVENDVVLRQTEYTLSNDNKFELALLQLTEYKIDLSGAIDNNGVKSISIKIDAPVTQRITKGEAKDYFRTLPPQNSCVEEILRSENLVIHNVLGARGVEYTFNGEGGSKMALTAEILQSIKASPSIAQQFKGATSLKYKADSADKGRLMLFGYRVWKAQEVPGSLTTVGEFVGLSKSDVQILKK